MDVHRTKHVRCHPEWNLNPRSRSAEQYIFSWPSPPSSPCPPITSLVPQPGLLAALHFKGLPQEIFSYLLTFLPLNAYLCFASTCRQFHATFTDDAFLNRILRGMMTSCSHPLFWILPVAAVDGEVVSAQKIASQWTQLADNAPSSAPNRESRSPFTTPDFPTLKFVRECYNSDSMKNRRRLWRNVKQIEDVWRDYRENGYQVDRFGSLPTDS